MDICPEISLLKKTTRAIQYMLLSTTAFAFMNALVKYLIHFPTFELVFFRSFFSLLIVGVVMQLQHISFRPTKGKLLLLRGIVGVTSMALFFLGAHYIPIGSAVTIRYIAPLFGGVLAVYFLKEKIWPMQWFFYLFAFVGVVFIKGFDASVSFLGVALVIAAAFFSANVYIIIGKIGHDDHPLRVVFYFMLIATITGAIGSVFNWIPPSNQELLLLILLGVLGYFGQFYMTKAFQYGEASKVAPFKYVEVVFTLCFGIYWFDEKYSLLSYLGILMVISGLTLSVLYKNLLNKGHNSSTPTK